MYSLGLLIPDHGSINCGLMYHLKLANWSASAASLELSQHMSSAAGKFAHWSSSLKKKLKYRCLIRSVNI